jgi:hypothetical protein
MLADATLGAKILGDITKLSAAMGTKIAVRDGVGYVELGAETNSQR